MVMDWDCPFAYVLCSLKETRSATAIEQIAGRVLRLPNAQAKLHPDLNCAYAFSVSDSITEVLAEFPREQPAPVNSAWGSAQRASRNGFPVQKAFPKIGNKCCNDCNMMLVVVHSLLEGGK